MSNQNNKKRPFKWYTDGDKVIKIFEGDSIPVSFYPGRKKKQSSESLPRTAISEQQLQSNINNQEMNLQAFPELSRLSDSEKKLFLDIIKEYQSKGQSKTFDDLRYQDYAEIPVDIDTFVDDDRYLGYAWKDSEGKSKLYPYWRKRLRELFPDNITTSVNNAIFSGARGLGKSEIAILTAAYLMYRVLCLKNPIEYFHLKPTEKLCFAFMNIKISLAEEIGNSKFQNTVKMSPWFMSHGTLVGRTNKLWTPPDCIQIIIGSQSSDVIGLPIYFCLDGKTQILTSDGTFNIEDLVDKQIQVPTVDDNNEIVLSDICTVKETAKSDIEYVIELEDNTVIRCTPNHRFRLVDGTYKEAQYLTEDDDIFSFTGSYKSCRMKIKSIKIAHLEEPKQYYDVINANPYNNFLVKTNSGYICSHNCFFDEISFIQNQDIDKQKQKAIDMIDTAIGGMKTRFLFNGKVNGLLTLASSKRSEKSFLEVHMKKKLESERENVLIVDEPVWNIKPPETYSGKRFKVALGNKFLPSKVIDDEADVKEFIYKGYTILSVPIEFKANFKEDIDRALCDFAGISSSELSKYISGEAVSEIIDKSLVNPFKKDIIEVGDGADDTAQYYDYFDLEKVPQNMMSKPLFVHLDMSISGDMTGIAGVWIKRKQTSTDQANQDKDLYFQLAFSVSVKAPKGRQVSFEKNRQFIYWLKEKGFKIKGITTDTFQSYDTGQALKARKFNYDILSVDRVDSDHICKPYQYFKSTIYEKRLKIYDSQTLIEEIVNLERNINSGKIDHPADFRKDVCDATCGSIYNASKHAEEFAYDFGEDMTTAVDVSSDISQASVREQVSVELEDLMKGLFNPIKQAPQQPVNQNNNRQQIAAQNTQPKSPYLDFGMGPAEEYKPAYLSDGIIVW